MAIPCLGCKPKFDELKREVEVHKGVIGLLNERLHEQRRFADLQSYAIDVLKARLVQARLGLPDNDGRGAADEAAALKVLTEEGT